MSGNNNIGSIIEQGLSWLNNLNGNNNNSYLGGGSMNMNSIWDMNMDMSKLPPELAGLFSWQNQMDNTIFQQTGLDPNKLYNFNPLQMVMDYSSTLGSFDLNGDGVAEDLSIVATQELKKSQQTKQAAQVDEGKKTEEKDEADDETAEAQNYFVAPDGQKMSFMRFDPMEGNFVFDQYQG